ncbi:MAG: hypothetical protein FWG68_00685 [Defluviitaleaceae bacterium]|nr:hypothetical protein [Defluviitaleaceae bacterium]
MEKSNYEVAFEPYANRHYLKTFRKKYKANWQPTEQSIKESCTRIDSMLKTDRADLIYSVDCYKLVKLDFTVYGTQTSPKAAGNRCILFVDENERKVKILLIYSKNEISSPNETPDRPSGGQKWQKVIADQYPQVKNIFGL